MSRSLLITKIKTYDKSEKNNKNFFENIKILATHKKSTANIITGNSPKAISPKTDLDTPKIISSFGDKDYGIYSRVKLYDKIVNIGSGKKHINFLQEENLSSMGNLIQVIRTNTSKKNFSKSEIHPPQTMDNIKEVEETSDLKDNLNKGNQTWQEINL